MHWDVETPRGPMHQVLRLPRVWCTRESQKLINWKIQNGSMHRGVETPPVSYEPVSHDSLVSYEPGSHDSQTKFLQIVDNYVTYNLSKFQIDSIKIEA